MVALPTKHFVFICLLATLPTLACSVHLPNDLPDHIACLDGADCPAEMRCALNLGRCVRLGVACIEERVGAYYAAKDGTPCVSPLGVAEICLAGVCQASICGDGVVDAALHEACDEGTANSDTAPDACRTNCTSPRCGDGTLDTGEACDDGNTVSRDGCRADCRKIEICGDGIVDENESCDDGNANPNDGCHACAATTWAADVVVGLGENGGVAQKLSLSTARGVAVDRAGNIFVSDMADNRIWRIDAVTHTPGVFAGTGVAGFSGDGGPATLAKLYWPGGLAVDAASNVVFADMINRRVRRIDGATGIITTVAGNGANCTAVLAPCGDASLAVLASLSFPVDVDFDTSGNLYIADQTAHTLRQVRALDAVIYTIAGTLGTPGVAIDGSTPDFLSSPSGLAVNTVGQIYVADYGNKLLRKIDLALDSIVTVAGTGVAGPVADGNVAATSAVGNLFDVTVCGADQPVFSEARKVRTIVGGLLQTVAGTGALGSSGDGGSAQSALVTPYGVACGWRGETTLVDSIANSVRQVAATGGVIETIAGGGASAPAASGGAATAYRRNGLYGIAVSPQGELHFVDRSHHAVYRVDKASGMVRLVAGTGASGNSGDGGAATAATLSIPVGIAFNAQGDLFIAVYGSHVVRKVDATTGIITTVAGTIGSAGSSGDTGLATSATLNMPQAVAVDAADNLYIYDGANHRVRKVTASTQVITTIIGSGVACTPATAVCGDGGPALSAQFGNNSSQTSVPGLAVDGAGNVYISDPALIRVRVYSPVALTLTRLMGDGTQCADTAACGDGGAASAALFGGQGGGARLGGVALGPDGSLYIGDARVRRIAPPVGPAANVSTIALTGIVTFAGDGRAATLATGGVALAVATDGAGNVFFDDLAHVRRVDAVTGVVTTVAAGVDPAGDGPGSLGQAGGPVALLNLDANRIAIADDLNGRVRLYDAANDLLRTVAGYPNGFADGIDPAKQARFSRLLLGPAGLGLDGNTLYVSERTGNLLRRVTLGSVSDPATYTIDNVASYSGGTEPRGLAFDAVHRRLFIADAGEHVVRALDVDSRPIPDGPAVRENDGLAC